ncbi:hypothetical protein TI05_15820, partial [Achromatium sp. WMS3]
MNTSYILVIDDEPDIRSLVKEILEDENYQVNTAESGEAARFSLRARRPELILLDIWMPNLDCITLLKELAEGEGLPCPVIMMSGHGTVETAVEATRLGAYDFLEKPLSLDKNGNSVHCIWKIKPGVIMNMTVQITNNPPFRIEHHIKKSVNVCIFIMFITSLSFGYQLIYID